MWCRSLGVETPAWCAAFWCSRYVQMSIAYFNKPLRYEERHDNKFVNKKYKQQWNAAEDHFGAAALRGAATAFQQTASVLASGEVACLCPTWLPSSRRVRHVFGAQLNVEYLCVRDGHVLIATLVRKRSIVQPGGFHLGPNGQIHSI